jgi:ATP-dependent RNA helicase RhlE
MPFAGLKLHPNLLRGLKDLGFNRPTPIQADAIPPALAGKDVLACAMTGSGKTAAFLLPILNALIEKPRGVTRALVLTPTRELAAQIVADLQDLAVHTPLTGAAVIGGVGMGEQEHAFRAGADVIVATPGRLLDHFRSAYAKLAGLEHLVLDEADRMLDMGFLPDIRRVLRHLPPRRQTYFFSATLPPPIVELSREMLRSPTRINLQRQSAPALGITHAIYPVPQHLKLDLLVALLDREIRNALVFTRTRHRADRISRQLVHDGVKAAQIHGDRSQGQRTAALAGFKSGKYRVLVATDIAARGIDIAELGHVVNLDLPKSADDYVHRVGRTGRMEAVGAAFTFVAPLEEEELRSIEDALGRRLPRVLLPDFDYDVPRTGSREASRSRAAAPAQRSRPATSTGTRPASQPAAPRAAPAPKPSPNSPGTGLGRRIRGNEGHRRRRRG